MCPKRQKSIKLIKIDKNWIWAKKGQKCQKTACTKTPISPRKLAVLGIKYIFSGFAKKEGLKIDPFAYYQSLVITRETLLYTYRGFMGAYFSVLFGWPPFFCVFYIFDKFCTSFFFQKIRKNPFFINFYQFLSILSIFLLKKWNLWPKNTSKKGKKRYFFKKNIFIFTFFFQNLDPQKQKFFIKIL